MTNKISKTQIEAAYLLAKKAYHTDVMEVEVVQELSELYGMNANSAKDYIRNFARMLQGLQYERTLNGPATEYYIKQIWNDYGQSGLKNALQALDLHIIYYESLGRGKPRNIRNIWERYSKEVGTHLSNTSADEVLDKNSLTEGAKVSITVNAYERNPKAREACIRHYGPVCKVCEFDFATTFGAIGQGYIHIHHLTPLHTLGEEYEVDPINDLRPVCPNCHAMLHRKSPPYTLEELQDIIGKQFE